MTGAYNIEKEKKNAHTDKLDVRIEFTGPA